MSMFEKMDSISVKVKLFGYSGSFSPSNGQDPMEGFLLELPHGARVKKAVKNLGIETRSFIPCFVNGERAGRNQRLKDGDNIVFFKPVAGG